MEYSTTMKAYINQNLIWKDEATQYGISSFDKNSVAVIAIDIAEGISDKTLWDFAMDSKILLIEESEEAKAFGGKQPLVSKADVVKYINNLDPTGKWQIDEDYLDGTVAVFVDQYGDEEYFDSFTGWRNSLEYWFDHPNQLVELLAEDGKELVKIYGYSHSGIAVSLVPFGCSFDSGCCGWAVIGDENERTMLEDALEDLTY